MHKSIPVAGKQKDFVQITMDSQVPLSQECDYWKQNLQKGSGSHGYSERQTPKLEMLGIDDKA